MLLKLLAAASALSTAAMVGFWAWQRRARTADAIAAVWPGVVAALAVFYATQGDGAWARRSAIGWMMGSWGARLLIQGVYTRAAAPPSPSPIRGLGLFVLLAGAAVGASLPALLASLDPTPELSIVELAACAVWVIGFTGETTADRQRLRFCSQPEHVGLPCRTGLWRYSPSIDRVFDGLMWCAYVLFGLAALSREAMFSNF